MPRATQGFEVNDLTQYRPAPMLADRDATTGFEASKFNAPSAVSGLLDFGPMVAAAVRLHAIASYRNAPTLTWRYSQDGAAWTEVTSSVLAGSVTDAALPPHHCAYSSETTATTLSAGIQARYWQASIQDDDVRVGAYWQCGGFAHSASAAALVEIWAEDANGTRLIELRLLPIAVGTAALSDVAAVVSESVQESVTGEGG